MARAIKKFQPKKKATLTPEPKWEKFAKCTTDEQYTKAFREVDQFVHYEITPREYVHSTRKWIRDHWDKEEFKDVALIPDTFMGNIGKNGWKAYKLGFMPEGVESSLKVEVRKLLGKLDTIRELMTYDAAIHPSVSSLDDDAKLHPNKVKEWISIWKKVAASYPKDDNSTDKTIAVVYVYNMQQYLKNGIWLDSHWGEKRENKMIYKCIAPAYDPITGEMKMTKNTYYPSANVIHGVTDVY
jgi:hypothetical protein